MKLKPTLKPTALDTQLETCVACGAPMVELKADPTAPRLIFFTKDRLESIVLCLHDLNRCRLAVDAVVGR